MNEKRIAILLMIGIGCWLLLLDRSAPPCRDVGFNPIEMTALSNMLLRENNLLKDNK